MGWHTSLSSAPEVVVKTRKIRRFTTEITGGGPGSITYTDYYREDEINEVEFRGLTQAAAEAGLTTILANGTGYEDFIDAEARRIGESDGFTIHAIEETLGTKTEVP